MRNNKPRLNLGKRICSNGHKLQYRKFWLAIRKNISPWRYSAIGTGMQRGCGITILGHILTWAGQAPFCNWTFLEPWFGLETSGDPFQNKLYVLNLYSHCNVIKMKDRSYCLGLVSQSPLHLPYKSHIRDCGPETISHGKPHFTVPWSASTAVPNRNSAGISHGRCRHLAPGDTGRGEWDHWHSSEEKSPSTAHPELSAGLILTQSLGLQPSSKHDIHLVCVRFCKYLLLYFNFFFHQQLYLCYSSMNHAFNRGKKCSK